ncbi:MULTISPECIES: ABC transporter ATP-binding protein [unclassified Rathayibacter]|uniref:ABC transporter ATP-binding protein n=1 Tax=unclassified Rathayibacter TaxID=2609250 RepID=UPI000F4BCDBF|nr:MULTISPECIES: ABC transporter ATP-binding protein [unclassified Rathayibacter]
MAIAVLAYLVKDSPIWVLPVITSAVIDTVVADGSPSTLLLLGAAALVLVALNYPAAQLFIRLFMSTVRDFGVALRNQLAHRLQELSIGFHTRSSSSVMQTKVVRDVENVELMMQQGANPLLSAFGVIVGALVVVAAQVPGFLVLFLLVVPVAVLLVRGVRARSESRNERFRRDVEHFSSQVGEMASLLPITRAHGLEGVAAHRMVQSARSVRDSGFSLDLLNGRFTALAWVVFQCLSIGCLIGAAYLSVTAVLPITAGQVVLLSTYFVMLTNSIVNLLNLAPIITKGRESLRSIAEVLEEPDVERNEGMRHPDRVVGRLSFEGTSFHYPESETPAVVAMDLDVRPGETVAFVGRSGSGKSTILNLALGFLRPTEGRILLDGVDMNRLDLRQVRRAVSVVPQESVLFTGSIRENVTYGMENVDDERVRQALRDANAWDLVVSLPAGLDTLLGEKGARLSGGQRQRISIARALIRDPRILLLDEATSALDSESEKLVQDALLRLRRGRTTLVVAHRLSTIRSADRIIVLDGGRIVEQGTHDELVAAGGVYAGLHAIQAG